MKHLPVISPTQISTWRLCKRKFAFTYLLGLPRAPQSKAQLIGVALHERAEQVINRNPPNYSSDPTNDPQVQAARLLPHILDRLPVGALSEQKVTVELDGVVFGGRFDWLISAPFDAQEKRVELGDLKTTSNLKYAKTAQDLAVDPQALIYSHGQEKLTDIPHTSVDCRWVYVQTKGFPHVREVRFQPDFSVMPELIHDGHLLQNLWSRYGALGSEGFDVQAFEPNTSACDAYGGCPFRSKCKIDPGDRLASLTKRMGLLSNPQEQNMSQKSFEEMMAEASGVEPAPINPPAAAGAQALVQVVRTEEKETLPPVLDPAQAVTKPKRTRKPKDTDPAPAPVPDPDEPQGAVVRLQPIGLLLISCLPRNKNACYDDLDLILADVRVEIKEKLGVDDYRLIDYKGAGVLSAAVEERIRALRPAVLFVDGRSPEGRILTGLLVSMAAAVFQGV